MSASMSARGPPQRNPKSQLRNNRQEACVQEVSKTEYSRERRLLETMPGSVITEEKVQPLKGAKRRTRKGYVSPIGAAR